MPDKQEKDAASDKVTEAEEPQIDDEQTRQRIIAALEAKSKGPTGACVICGDNNWAIGFFSPIPISFGAKGMSTFGPRIYPTVAIICNNCGNTHFINVRILGFTDEDMEQMKFEPPPETPKSESPDA